MNDIDVYDGSWKPSKKISVRDGGSWKEAEGVWVRDGGSWKKVYEKVYPPQNVSASEDAFNGGVDITWDDPVNGQPSSNGNYRLEMRVNLGTWSIVDLNISNTANSYHHGGCGADFSNGDDVEYRMKAEDDGQISDYSNVSNSVAINAC